MLWYNLNGCPAKYAFNVGASLKSGFQRCGIFPFSPDIIRNTVQSHHEPEKMMRQIRQQEQEQDFEPMFELLRTRYGVTSDVDLNDFKEYLLLKQLGLTSGTALASAVQKTLFGEAPQKNRRVKNSHLSTEAGALVTSTEFIEALEMVTAERKGKKAAVLTRRKLTKGIPQEPQAKKQRKA